MKCRAFTLIELLIVVAIIAILAAIAVPNLLVAQTRSKVARVKAEFRTFATVLETYAVDWTSYPRSKSYSQLMTYYELTTPIAYISNLSMIDPFNSSDSYSGNGQDKYGYGGDWLSYGYMNLPVHRARRGWDLHSLPPAWMLHSGGPDRRDSGTRRPGQTGGTVNIFGREDPHKNAFYSHSLYDPSNGTVSRGDILRWGP